MFGYCFTSSPSFSYSTDVVDKIFESISKNINTPQNGILNIVFVSRNKIQELNKTYRKKDSPTDVLSFHYYDDFSWLWEEDVAGEIVICEDILIEQAQNESEQELYILTIHSILHILGYDHETDGEYEEMRKWEEFVWRDIF